MGSIYFSKSLFHAIMGVIHRPDWPGLVVCMEMRLQKMLAHAGVASRRASEQLILQGRVQVNGRVVTEMGTKVDPRRDVIVVDGKRVRVARKRRYYKLHKPAGYLSVMRDSRGRRTLADLVPNVDGLHPVGRLDLDSEGLILLTDDGELTQLLTHPRYEHSKEYLVLVRGVPKRNVVRDLQAGIELEDGKTSPARVTQPVETPLGSAPRGQTWLKMVIHEGRKRQIRRMCAAIGHPVQRLVRVRVGPIELEDLPIGSYRPLTRSELHRLRTVVGLSDNP
jgi:pseudouridine synthase